jgi:hypothetical protein
MHDHGGGGGGDFGGGSFGGHHDAGGGFDASGHSHHSHHSHHQDRAFDLPGPAGLTDPGLYGGRAARRGYRWPAIGTPMWYVRLGSTLVFLTIFGFIAYEVISGFLNQSAAP